MKNNIKDLSLELIKDIKNLEGFKSHLIEEELIHNLSIKLDKLNSEEKDERIKALCNMFALGQIFKNQTDE